MTEASHAYGTVIRVGNAAVPETFTAIAEITSLTPPPFVQEAIEATHMESPDKFREFIPGLRDAGEFSFDINFIPENPTHDWIDGVVGKVFNGAVNNYQLQVPSTPAVIVTMRGFFSQFQLNAPIDGVLTATCTLRVSGKPTFALA